MTLEQDDCFGDHESLNGLNFGYTAISTIPCVVFYVPIKELRHSELLRESLVKSAMKLEATDSILRK